MDIYQRIIINYKMCEEFVANHCDIAYLTVILPVPLARLHPLAPSTIFSARYLVTEYPGTRISLSDATAFTLLSVKLTKTANGANPM